MVNNRRRDICTIIILGILCIITLSIIVYALLGNTGSSSNQTSQSTEASHGSDLTDGEQKKDNVSTVTSPEEMSFSYSQHQACGVKRNVYCVLLDDFSPSSDWQQRIRKTISQYIDAELGGGSANDYLIYFFRNSECYKQKIASKATEMCSIPNGEVAASSWGKVYYEYGKGE